MKELLELLARLLGPEICKAFKQHPVLGLLLVFLIALWAIALPTKTISLGYIVGLTLAIVILGLLSEGFNRIIRSRRVPASPSNAVLFDETHGQEKWGRNNPAPTIDKGYMRIAGITRQHYAVEVLEAGKAISLEKLREYAAFILTIGPQGLCSLKEDELKAIRDYVRQGGGVLILSTYTGDWHHEANLNRLAEDYGMTFNNDVVMQKDATPHHARYQLFEGKPSSKCVVLAQPVEDDGIQDTIKTELLKDVRQIVTLSSCSLNITDAATAVLRSGSESTVFEPEPTGRGINIRSYRERGKGPVALVGASKAGKVVTVGSWKTFLDDFVNEPNYDNARLYENILHWLTARR